MILQRLDHRPRHQRRPGIVQIGAMFGSGRIGLILFRSMITFFPGLEARAAQSSERPITCQNRSVGAFTSISDQDSQGRLSAMVIEIAIFDLDDVLCRYDLGRRLRVLSQVSGKMPRDIRAALWDSGFEDAADAGHYPTAEEYLAEFGRRLGHPITRAQWIEARRASITPWTNMLALTREIGLEKRIALFSNNGPLMKESLAQVFPEAAKTFGQDCYFSCEFRSKKPDPESYRRLLARLGIEPAAAWFTDDKKSNVDGARIAGLQTHHFVSEAQLRREFIEMQLIPS
jgi:glucose-1-phosphatase